MLSMQFKKWVESERGRAGALAVYLKVPPSFVSKMVSGEKPIPVSHGADIEAFSAGQVTRQEMFPGDWARIWPELVQLSTGGQRAALSARATPTPVADYISCTAVAQPALISSALVKEI